MTAPSDSSLFEGVLDSVTKPRESVLHGQRSRLCRPLPKTIPQVIDTTTIHSHTSSASTLPFPSCCLTSHRHSKSAVSRPCLFGTHSWRLAGGTGSTAGLLRNPAAVFLPDSSSRHFIPGPHTGARVCFRLSAPGSIGIWKCRSQRKRGATRATRPRDHATNVADSARLISVRELGRGVDGGCPREGLESAECRQGPGENQWACGVSGSVGWELRAEADDLQAAGGSSTILSISHCHAML